MTLDPRDGGRDPFAEVERAIADGAERPPPPVPVTAPAPLDSAAPAAPDGAAPAPDRVSRWPVVGAALLVGVLAGAAWFAVQLDNERRRSEAAAATAAAVAAQASAAAAAAAQREADIAKLLHVEPPAEPASAPLPAGQVLVCGQPVAREALAEDRIAQSLDEAGAAQAIERFAADKLTDDDHARAVAIALRLLVESHYRDGPDSLRACRDEACWRRAQRALAERMAPQRDTLAALAARSSDARAFALARHVCRQFAPADAAASPHCQGLTARRLVALERDNAAAWVELAAEEPAAIDEAMYQAAIAPRWDDHALAARRFVERVDARGGLASLAVTQALLSVPDSRDVGALQLVQQHCGGRALADANRRQQCEQLASGLIERSRNLLLHGGGLALGDALGRADTAARRADAQLLAFVMAEGEQDGELRETLDAGCGLGLPRELLVRSAQAGEIDAAREALRRSGVSEAQWRERLQAAVAAQAAPQAIDGTRGQERAASAPADPAGTPTGSAIVAR